MKRKLVKRMTALTASAVMMAGALMGCTDPGASKDSGASAKPQVNEDGTVDTSDEVELVMYVISDRPAGQDVVDENLNKILKEKLNCTLKVNYIGWAEYANKYPLLFSSGEEFDMAYCATWVNFNSLAQKGAFMNLDELWETCAPENFSKASENAKLQVTVNDHYYAVPTLLSTYNAYGLLYRTDLVEGTDWNGKMDTFEDVEAYCDIVKETHPEVEPLDIDSSGPQWQHLFYYDEGYSYVNNFVVFDPTDEKPQVMANYDVEGLPEFLEMMKRWNEKGFFSKSALSDTDTTKTADGKAAIKVHNLDTFRDLSVQHPEYKFAYANYRKNLAHLPYTQDCMVISNTSKNPERALAFWDLVTSDQEVYDAMFYGVLGTTYELNDKGQYTILDTDLYSTGAMWGARTDGLERQAAGTPEEYQMLKDQFESEIVEGEGNEKYAGFVFDTSAIETEFAACNNVYQQYFYPLVLGYTDAETGLAEYKEKIQAAGIEKIMEEAQRQLDEYLAGLDS